MKKKFRSFDDARKFARSIKIKNGNEWNTYCNSGNRPSDIPFRPDQVYKNKGWTTWGDFVGTGFVNYRDRVYLPFEEAKKYSHNLKLKSSKEWLEYCNSGKKPDDIPSTPFKIYKNEWKSYSNWLGYTPVVRFRKKKLEFTDFLSTRQIIQSFDLKNLYEFRELVKKIGEKENIPAHPERVFKKEWKGWGDFLGTGNVAATTKSKNYLPFNEARKEARKLAKKYNLKNSDDWRKAVRDGKIPKNIPLVPHRVYSKIKRKYK